MFNPADGFIAPPCTAELGFLYQDTDIVLLEKPSGLLAVPGQHPRNKDSVLSRLQQRFPQAKLAHRLDFGTSGLMLACLSAHAIAHVNRQFQQRTVTKNYIALLAGRLEQEQGSIDLPIARAAFPLQKICSEKGKPAQSDYQLLAHESTVCGFPVSRVRYHPVTGRTHQLRLHSLAIQHPILGCDLYRAGVQGHGREVCSYSLASRLLLHASALAFDHPDTGRRMVFESQCPF